MLIYNRQTKTWTPLSKRKKSKKRLLACLLMTSAIICVAMLNSCTTYSDTFCMKYTRMRPLSGAVIEAMSEAEMDRIIENDKQYDRLCK